MAKISGTFSGTGQSDTFVSGSALVILDFGTGTVSVEAYDPDNGNWVIIGSAFTADTVTKYDGYGKTQLRLNCTVHSGNIDYCVFT